MKRFTIKAEEDPNDFRRTAQYLCTNAQGRKGLTKRMLTDTAMDTLILENKTI